MKSPSLSLVFPMYNEQENAAKVIDAALTALSELSPDHEVIAVDDGSTDRTASIVRELAAQRPNVKFVKHPHNQGLGASLRSGFSQAQKDLIVYSDADFPFELSEIGKAIALLGREEADVFCAYRLNREAEGWLRTVYSAVYNFLIHTLFRLNVRDVNFSFKILTRNALIEILPLLRSEGSFIDAELLVQARRKGCKIVQQGVEYFPRIRGESTLSSPGVILKILKEMIGFCFASHKTDVRRELLARYRKLGLKDRLHVYFRYKSCPFAAIERFVCKSGDILDFGCGHGVFTNYLALTSAGRKVTGTDLSEKKIGLARDCDGHPNISYELNTSAGIPERNFDTIVIVDVLYLLSYPAQERLIGECVKRLNPSGRLVIKEMDKRPRIKYFWNVFQETLAVKLLKITKGKEFYFRGREEFEALFKGLGLKVEAHDLSKGYFHPHILFVCTK